VIDSFDGCQVGGLMNLMEDGKFRGVQISGISNFTERMRGVQISIINIAGVLNGVQIGVINYAHKVNGAQIGLFNLANHIKGTSFGLLGLVAHGRKELSTFLDSEGFLNSSLIIGGDNIYRIYSHSFSLKQIRYDSNDWRGDRDWKLSMGYGIQKDINEQLFTNIEFTYNQLFRGGTFFRYWEVINTLRLQIGLELFSGIALIGGVSTNLFLSRYRDGSQFETLHIWNNNGTTSHARIWTGFHIGIKL